MHVCDIAEATLAGVPIQSSWRRTVDVNLNGQFYCPRLAVSMLKASGEGAIINVASVAGRLGYAFRTPYAATKWAIVGLTKSLGIELGPAGVRVNAILPGIVQGPRMQRVIEARALQLGVEYDEMEQTYLNKTSLRRMVSAEMSPPGRCFSAHWPVATSPGRRSASAATSRHSDGRSSAAG